MTREKIIIIIGLFLSSSVSIAGSAKCTITIWDLIKDNKYTLEKNFTFGTGDAPQLELFDLPGNDYKCRFIFHKTGDGTMLSCLSKEDKNTFFMSDRTTLKNENTTINNLTFRHKKSHIQIKTKCE
ncbi:MAG: hypothetical protein OEZ39_09305 [Gammaproteobacteria bacterium]|nr:hypothetical protein [Gammaproteobacteria bacterium]MDH5652041.1 hypothetical protein [Gammaproteobacteria bacterium]